MPRKWRAPAFVNGIVIIGFYMGSLLLAAHSWYVQSLQDLVGLNYGDEEMVLSLKIAKNREEADMLFSEASPLGGLDQITSSSRYAVVLDDNGIAIARSVLAQDDAVRLVILHCSAVDYIARALEQNVSLENAAGRWLDLAREQLATFRAFRPRVVLVNAYECLSRPLILAELADLEAVALADYETPKRPNAVARWLASQCIASDPILRDWVDQVEACATPVDGEPLSGAGFGEMLADWRAMVESRAEIDAQARSIADEVSLSKRKAEAESKQRDANIAELEHTAAITRANSKRQAERIADLENDLKEERQESLKKDKYTASIEPKIKQQADYIAGLERKLEDIGHQVVMQGESAASLEYQLNAVLNNLTANQKRMKELEDEASLLWKQIYESQAIMEKWISDINVGADRVSLQTLSRNAPLRQGLAMDVNFEFSKLDIVNILS